MSCRWKKPKLMLCALDYSTVSASMAAGNEISNRYFLELFIVLGGFVEKILFMTIVDVLKSFGYSLIQCIVLLL